MAETTGEVVSLLSMRLFSLSLSFQSHWAELGFLSTLHSPADAYCRLGPSCPSLLAPVADGSSTWRSSVLVSVDTMVLWAPDISGTSQHQPSGENGLLSLKRISIFFSSTGFSSRCFWENFYCGHRLITSRSTGCSPHVALAVYARGTNWPTTLYS